MVWGGVSSIESTVLVTATDIYLCYSVRRSCVLRNAVVIFTDMYGTVVCVVSKMSRGVQCQEM